MLLLLSPVDRGEDLILATEGLDSTLMSLSSAVDDIARQRESLWEEVDGDGLEVARGELRHVVQCLLYRRRFEEG